MTVTRNYLQEALASGGDLWSAGGASSDQVAALEAALQIVLPDGYRTFLGSVGSLAIGDNSISGIIDGNPLSLDGGSLFGDTIRARQEQHLPSHLLVIQPDGDAPYCIDLSAQVSGAESPVVCFEASSSTETRIADSFEQWFSTFFLGRV
jgi:hypothetical protein